MMNEDNISKGYFKLYRSLCNSDLWLNEPFTKGQAWVDLIYLARFKKGNMQIKNGTILNIDIGEVGISYKGLGDRWSWSRQKVVRFVDRLVDAGMLHLKKAENRCIICITNYDRYQGVTLNETVNEPLNDTLNETVNEHNRNKEINEIKEIKEINTTTNNMADYNFKNFYGEYKNVYLIQSDIKKLETYTQSKEKLKKLIDELDVAIETQKEKPYNSEHIHAHYERIKAFCDFQRKYPNGRGVTNTFTRYKSEAEKKAEKIREMKERGLL